MLEDSIMIRGSVSHILPRFPKSGGSDSSLCEALFLQIDISRLDSVSRLAVFMHCLVFSQVFPRHFVQQSTRLRREHIVAVKKPTTEPNLPLPRGDQRLVDNCSLVPLYIIWIINRYMLDIYADNTNNGWLCFSFLLSLFPLVKKSPGIIDIYQYSILIVAM